MNRNGFRQLLKRYVAGAASNEEKRLIDHWYTILYNDSVDALNDAELEAIEHEMWHKIEQQAQIKKEATPVEVLPLYKIIVRWAAAAAIMAGVSIGIYGIFSSPQKSVAYQQSKEENKLAEIINAGAGTKKVQLKDGSVVTLQPAARLAYPDQFAADKREVYLEGEAFFDVAKNPAKPFFVHSGNLVTQVLGTSFNIKPDRETNQITVAVKTGKVAVFEDNKQVALTKEQQKNNGAIVTPNQKVIYYTTSRNFATSLVENPEPILPAGDSAMMITSFSYDDAPLATVLQNVEKVYGIEILTENENIYQCKFTGNINSQSLYDKLVLICESTNHQYEIKGTKILIKGKGCN